MKTMFLIFVCILTVQISNAQWVQTSGGLGDVIIYSITNNESKLFAGTISSGLYSSTNNGTDWSFASLNEVCYALAANGNNIFAGTVGHGIFLSTNNGVNWNQTSLTDRTVRAFAISGNNIFAGTSSGDAGVLLSTDNGTSWSQTPLINESVYSLAVSGNNIFAGTINSRGVFLSTNNGVSWNQTSLNNRSVRSLAVSGNNIFAGTGGYGVFLSTNNGTTWTQTTLNFSIGFSLAVYGNNTFAGMGFNSGVYVSTDNGTSWTQRNEALENLYIYAYSIKNNYIFVGTGGKGIYRRPLSELVPSPVAGSLNLIVEGFYNTVTGKLNIKDTVRAYLKNITTPFASVDSAKAVIDSVTLTGSFLFQNAPSGRYYLQVKHRNSIETWSKDTGEVYTLGTGMNYDFTTSVSQAFGNNLIQKGNKFCIFSGDVNQDGIVDGSDAAIIDNDIFNFATGYIVSDVTGDDITDGSDAAIADNNAANFVMMIAP